MERLGFDDPAAVFGDTFGDHRYVANQSDGSRIWEPVPSTLETRVSALEAASDLLSGPSVTPINMPTDATVDGPPQVFSIPKIVNGVGVTQVTATVIDRRPATGTGDDIQISAADLDSGAVVFTDPLNVYRYTWTVTDGGATWDVSSQDEHADFANNGPILGTNRYGSVASVIPQYPNEKPSLAGPTLNTLADLTAFPAADIVPGQRHYVNVQRAMYMWDATTTSGVEADDGGMTGRWVSIGPGFDPADQGEPWANAHEYIAAVSLVQQSNKLYVAAQTHTAAADFATDLAANRWEEVAGTASTVGPSVAYPAGDAEATINAVNIIADTQTLTLPPVAAGAWIAVQHEGAGTGTVDGIGTTTGDGAYYLWIADATGTTWEASAQPDSATVAAFTLPEVLGGNAPYNDTDAKTITASKLDQAITSRVGGQSERTYTAGMTIADDEYVWNEGIRWRARSAGTHPAPPSGSLWKLAPGGRIVKAEDHIGSFSMVGTMVEVAYPGETGRSIWRKLVPTGPIQSPFNQHLNGDENATLLWERVTPSEGTAGGTPSVAQFHEIQNLGGANTGFTMDTVNGYIGADAIVVAGGNLDCRILIPDDTRTRTITWVVRKTATEQTVGVEGRDNTGGHSGWALLNTLDGSVRFVTENDAAIAPTVTASAVDVAGADYWEFTAAVTGKTGNAGGQDYIFLTIAGPAFVPGSGTFIVHTEDIYLGQVKYEVGPAPKIWALGERSTGETWVDGNEIYEYGFDTTIITQNTAHVMGPTDVLHYISHEGHIQSGLSQIPFDFWDETTTARTYKSTSHNIILFTNWTTDPMSATGVFRYTKR